MDRTLGGSGRAGVSFRDGRLCREMQAFVRNVEPSSAYRRAVGGRRILGGRERVFVPLAPEPARAVWRTSGLRWRTRGGINLEPCNLQR